MTAPRLAGTTLRLLILAVALALVVGIGLGPLLGLLGLSNPLAARTIDRSQPAVLKSIQELSEYHAAAGSFEVVLDIEQDVPWVPSVIAGSRSLFVAAGTVDAYLDFSGLADGDLTMSDDGKTATIRLPAAELDKPNLDQDKTYLFSRDRGLVDKYKDFFSTNDQSDLYRKAEEKLASAAKKSELRTQAEENTKAMLTGMFKALGIRAIFTTPYSRSAS